MTERLNEIIDESTGKHETAMTKAKMVHHTWRASEIKEILVHVFGLSIGLNILLAALNT